MTVSQKSIRTNFIYNASLRILNIVFPLITFPYIARILSPEGIGKIDFSLSIVQYFIMFSQVGIPTYAIRECAKHRDNKKMLSKTVQEILLINFIMIVFAYLILFVMTFSVSELEDNKTLIFIFSINILSTSIGVEWFYQAIEDFRLITIRSFFVKMASLILIFTMINDKNDYTLYTMISVISLSLGYIYNFIHLNKHINLFHKYSDYNILKHLKPVAVLFAMSISVSIYANLDKVMLGFISGNKYVAYYSAANRMVKVVLALVTSLGTVLLPRMSYYISKNDEKSILTLVSKSIDFTLLISLPAVIGLIMMSEQIIYIFAGKEYYQAIPTIKILSPILIAIALSNLIGIQILIAHGKEKMTLISTIVGSVFNIILNIFLIPVAFHNGAAIATVVAEFAVTFTQIYFARNYIIGNIDLINLKNYLIGTFLIIIVCKLGWFIFGRGIVINIVIVISSIIIYFLFLYYMNNAIIVEGFKRFRKNVIKK